MRSSPRPRRPSSTFRETVYSVQGLSLVILLLAVAAIQLFLPHLPAKLVGVREDPSRQLALREAVCPSLPPLGLLSEQICPRTSLTTVTRTVGFGSEAFGKRGLYTGRSFETPSPRNMALLEAAKKVAAEFEYSDEEVGRGVKEFIREMGE